MEPCLFRHGKALTALERKNVFEIASMEPCLFRHGKVLRVRDRAHCRKGFNGAMSFQTW